MCVCVCVCPFFIVFGVYIFCTSIFLGDPCVVPDGGGLNPRGSSLGDGLGWPTGPQMGPGTPGIDLFVVVKHLGSLGCSRVKHPSPELQKNQLIH